MKTKIALLIIAIILATIMTAPAQAQGIPKISVEVGQTTKPGELSSTLQIVLLLTVLTLAPSIILMITSFVRIIVVLGFLRQAIGTQQLPPNQLLISLALILTFFIMSPMANKAYNEGLKPYLDEKINKEEAFQKGMEPFRKFMLAQTREKDLALFVNLAHLPKPNSPDDVPLHILIPGFVPVGIADGIPDCLFDFCSVPDYRHDCGVGADGDGYDDVAADYCGIAIQDSFVCAG